jgi:hypothetical protein
VDHAGGYVGERGVELQQPVETRRAPRRRAGSIRRGSSDATAPRFPARRRRLPATPGHVGSPGDHGRPGRRRAPSPGVAEVSARPRHEARARRQSTLALTRTSSTKGCAAAGIRWWASATDPTVAGPLVAGASRPPPSQRRRPRLGEVDRDLPGVSPGPPQGPVGHLWQRRPARRVDLHRRPRPGARPRRPTHQTHRPTHRPRPPLRASDRGTPLQTRAPLRRPTARVRELIAARNLVLRVRSRARADPQLPDAVRRRPCRLRPAPGAVSPAPAADALPVPDWRARTAGRHRWILVTGGAGSGKTRLAVAWTRRALAHNERVWLFPLSRAARRRARPRPASG